MSNGSAKPKFLIDSMQEINESDQKCYIWAAIANEVDQMGLGLTMHANDESNIDYGHILVESRNDNCSFKSFYKHEFMFLGTFSCQ